MHTIRKIVGCTLTILLVLAGCATKPGLPGQTLEDADNSLFEIRQMLRNRSNALMKGDVESYLRPLSPESRATEEPIARGAVSLPLASLDLLFRPPQSASLNASSYKDVPTFVSYRFKGLAADNIFRVRLVYDVERTGRRWTVTKSVISDGEVLAPWFKGPIEVDHSPHFLVLFRPGAKGVKEGAALAEQALSQVRSQLTLIPDKKHLLVLASDNADFEQALGRPSDALGVAQSVYEGDGLARQRRITVDMAAAFSDPSGTQASHAGELTPLKIFQHEIAHLLLSRYTSPLTPGWAVEGAAMYLSGERRGTEWSIIHQQGLLETDRSHILLQGESVRGESGLAGALYPYANAAVLVLVEGFGKERFWNFYRGYRLAESEGDPNQTAALTQDLLRGHFGLDEHELDARTREFMKDQSGP